MRLIDHGAGFAMDLWLAARQMTRSPAFAALVVGLLAVGVGTNAAMFALMDALLFRPPFHVANPESVVRLQFRVGDGPDAEWIERTHYSSFVDIERSGAFEAVAAFSPISVSIGSGSDATLAQALAVSGRFFDVLQPRLAAASHAEDAAVEGDDQALISHEFWLRRFDRAPNAVGSTLAIDGKSWTSSLSISVRCAA